MSPGGIPGLIHARQTWQPKRRIQPQGQQNYQPQSQAVDKNKIKAEKRKEKLEKFVRDYNDYLVEQRIAAADKLESLTRKIRKQHNNTVPKEQATPTASSINTDTYIKDFNKPAYDLFNYNNPEAKTIIDNLASTGKMSKVDFSKSDLFASKYTDKKLVKDQQGRDETNVKAGEKVKYYAQKHRGKIVAAGVAAAFIVPYSANLIEKGLEKAKIWDNDTKTVEVEVEVPVNVHELDNMLKDQGFSDATLEQMTLAQKAENASKVSIVNYLVDNAEKFNVTDSKMDLYMNYSPQQLAQMATLNTEIPVEVPVNVYVDESLENALRAQGFTNDTLNEMNTPAKALAASKIGLVNYIWDNKERLEVTEDTKMDLYPLSVDELGQLAEIEIPGETVTVEKPVYHNNTIDNSKDAIITWLNENTHMSKDYLSGLSNETLYGYISKNGLVQTLQEKGLAGTNTEKQLYNMTLDDLQSMLLDEHTVLFNKAKTLANDVFTDSELSEKTNTELENIVRVDDEVEKYAEITGAVKAKALYDKTSSEIQDMTLNYMLEKYDSALESTYGADAFIGATSSQRTQMSQDISAMGYESSNIDSQEELTALSAKLGADNPMYKSIEYQVKIGNGVKILNTPGEGGVYETYDLETGATAGLPYGKISSTDIKSIYDNARGEE